VPAWTRPTLTHHRIEDAEPPGHHGVGGGDHLRHRGDRVSGQVRGGTVPATPDHPHLDLVGAGHHRAGFGGEGAEGIETRPHVNGPSGLGAPARDVEETLVQHVEAAVDAFLARLELEDHVPGQFVAVRDEGLDRPHQQRHVQVVATSVHVPVRRGEGFARQFLHGQRVHVAAQQHHGAFAPARGGAAQHRDDAAQRPAQCDLQRQPFEGFQDPGLGQRQMETHLGDLVEFAAQGHEFGVQLVAVLPDVHGPQVFHEPADRREPPASRLASAQCRVNAVKNIRCPHASRP